MNRIPACSASLLAAVAFVSACSKQSPKPADTAAPKPTNITVTPDQRQRIHLITVQLVSYRPIVEATGNVAFNGDRSTQVLSPVSGPATRVVGQVGMTVHKGEPLAYVSSPDFASAVADYRKAQTAWRNAKRIADRDSALFKNDALGAANTARATLDRSLCLTPMTGAGAP